MNQAATSKEELLEISRQIVIEEGISAISMRTIANKCHVAVGSIYNYFPSKADLIGATIETIWKDIFKMAPQESEFTGLTDCLLYLFENIKNGGKKYPNFFSVHSLTFSDYEKAKGKQIMDEYFGYLKAKLLNIIKADSHIRPQAFNQLITPEIYIDYIFTIFISLLLDKKEDCSALVEMINNYLY